jgi:hypothetical protein
LLIGIWYTRLGIKTSPRRFLTLPVVYFPHDYRY